MDDTWAKLTAGFKAEFNSIPVVGMKLMKKENEYQ